MSSRSSTVIGCAILVALAWLLLCSTSARSFSFLQDAGQVREWLRQWGAWVPLAIMLMQAVQVLLAPVPGNVVSVASGYLLGIGWGTFYSVLGTLAGSLLAFTVVRTFGRPAAALLMPPETLATLDATMRRRGLSFIVLIFLLPFLPDDLVCLAAGLTTIPIPALALAVLVGRPPGILVSAWLGATAAELGRGEWFAIVALCATATALFVRYGESLQDKALSWIERLPHLRG